MQCPVCNHDLSPHTLLDSQLPAYQCPNCAGEWISSDEYLHWLQGRGPALPVIPEEDKDIPELDTAQAKMCPNCGHYLMRYRILPNAAFFLDRCANCNGVWFDKGEWQVLVDRNLHDKINQFFTRPWQTHIQEEEARAMLDKLYLDRFGADDYTKIKQIYDWLIHHPQRSMLLAYLQSNNPYKI